MMCPLHVSSSPAELVRRRTNRRVSVGGVLELRELRPDDWHLWRDVRLQALADAPEAFSSRLADWQGEGDREERWRNRLENVGFHVVAILDGVPVGQASGTAVDEHLAVEVLSVWVHPAARGSVLGVAAEMIESVADWARRCGASSLSLQVVRDNGRARTLYERTGFVLDEGAPSAPDEITMSRPLRP